MHTAEVDKAIFNTETNVAGHLVLQPGADGPSVPPVAQGKSVNSITPRHIDVSASPSGLGIDKPLVGRKAQTTSYGGYRVDVGAVGPGRRLRAVKVVAQRGTAQRGFRTDHQISELLIVSDLAATDETTGIIIDALSRQIDVGPVYSRPSTTDGAANVEACPAYEWYCSVRLSRPLIAVSHSRGRDESGREGDECAKGEEAKLHRACPYIVKLSSFERRAIAVLGQQSGAAIENDHLLRSGN